MHEETINTRTVFTGKALQLDVLDVKLSTGRSSIREIIRHPGAAVVLARLPNGSFVFVKQYRKAVEQVILETVAGTLEPNENPLECASRELREETGYDAESIHKLGVIYPSPGYSEEIHHIYLADLFPVEETPEPDEDEILDTVILSENEINELIDREEIRDAKTLVAWMYFQRAKSEERGAGSGERK
ncbi:NUDIX hydrolase [PVC group bacterium]|nr:NUDIX hydrolase [PVC group bacterium]